MDISLGREYDLSEAAEILGVTPSWLRRLFYNGEIKAVERPWGKRKKLFILGLDLAARLEATRAPSSDYEIAVAEWTQWMENGTYFNDGKPMSPRTIEGYTYGLNAFWEAVELERQVSAVGVGTLHLALSKIPRELPGKRGKVYEAVIAFGKYLHRKGHLSAYTLHQLKELRPKQSGPQRRTSTNAQGVLDAIAAMDTGYGDDKRLCSRLIVKLMAYEGLRRQEVIDLRVDQVNLKEGYLRVVGKGRKERKVPIELEVESDLRQWLKERPKSDAPNLLLQPNGDPITPSVIRKRFARINKKIDITPHGMRRTCATIDHNVHGLSSHLGALKMGHADLRTYERYLMSQEKDLLDFAHVRREAATQKPKEKKKAPL